MYLIATIHKLHVTLIVLYLCELITIIVIKWWNSRSGEILFSDWFPEWATWVSYIDPTLKEFSFRP